jgi:hypothetical protein
MAGRRTVNPLTLVRPQPPERKSHGPVGEFGRPRLPVKQKIAGSNPVRTAFPWCSGEHGGLRNRQGGFESFREYSSISSSTAEHRLHRPEANRNEAASSVVLFVQLHIRTDVRYHWTMRRRSWSDEQLIHIPIGEVAGYRAMARFRLAGTGDERSTAHYAARFRLVAQQDRALVS